MKHVEARPYADAEAAARKLLELARGVPPIDDRIDIEINEPFLSRNGCKASGAEFEAGLSSAVEKGWLELHESGTFVKLLSVGDSLLNGE